MMRRLIPLLLSLAAAPAVSEVPVGETHRVAHETAAAVRDAGHRDSLRITIWYPAAPGSVEQPIVIGPDTHPIFTIGRAAMDAPPAPDSSGPRRPLILLSHGYGGTARMMGWFGIAMARRGYVVVAVDHPGNNGLDPMTLPGALLSWQRAIDLRAALDAVRADPLFGPRIDPLRIGVAGFSAGGFTALLAAGARADPARFLRFCARHPEDGVCAPQKEFPIGAAQRDALFADAAYAEPIRHAGDDLSIPHVRAVFTIAPAIVQSLDPSSLKRLAMPVGIILGDGDSVVPPAFNGEAAARLIPHAQLTILPGATHYDFLADCDPAAGIGLCAQARHQQEAHETAIALAGRLFDRAFGQAPSAKPAVSPR
jgi:predicted dienelactone hydrolase